MRSKIDSTKFGSIDITGKRYDHDVVISLDGKIEKRKKKLSSAIYGTSHMISLDEVRHTYEDEATLLIIGTGQTGLVKLSPEATAFLKEKSCQVQMLPTPQAIDAWNEAKGKVIGLFHVTC